MRAIKTNYWVITNKNSWLTPVAIDKSFKKMLFYTEQIEYVPNDNALAVTLNLLFGGINHFSFLTLFR